VIDERGDDAAARPFAHAHDGGGITGRQSAAIEQRWESYWLGDRSLLRRTSMRRRSADTQWAADGGVDPSVQRRAICGRHQPFWVDGNWVSLVSWAIDMGREF
jgi:hypothetical protein